LRNEQKILKYKGRVVFEKLSVPDFTRLPKEYFEQEACFIFVNKGGFSIRAQDEYLDFEQGSAVLAKCLNYFFEANKNKGTGTGVEVIGLLLYPDLVQELFQFDLSTSSHTVDYNIKKVVVNKLLENFKESISILLDHPDVADEALIKNKLKEFVMLISKSVDAPSELDFLAAMFKPRFADFKAIIHANLYSNLSLNEFAALCHLSTSTFKRKFKDVFSESPKKYISRLRITHAAGLLKTQEGRISDIAYDLGFESIATFNRAFKAQFNVSPSAYRLT